MNTHNTLILAALAATLTTATADEEPVALERDEGASTAWRVSVGVRTAPSIKTKASLDIPAAIGRAGRLSSFGKSSSSLTTSTTAGSGTSSGSGRTKEEALAAAAQQSDGSYEFDNGFIKPDSAGYAGETWNWHFNSADAYSDGTISGTTAFGTGDGSSSTTTKRETRTSFSETTAPDFLDSSDETATGFELELARELWSNDAFAVDLTIGWTYYDDVDVFQMAGRAYTGRASSRTSSEKSTTTSGSSGMITTTFEVGGAFDLDYSTNPDGSIGGASFDGIPTQEGWGTPLLVYNPDTVSTTVTETGSGEGGTTTSRSAGKSKSRTRTVDVRSEGELSLQEIRLGLSPYWKVTEWLDVRANLGALFSYAEIETRTRIYADGAETWRSSHTDDDWKVQVYAGLALAVKPKDWLEVSAGVDTRFPNRSVAFNDGIVSGSVELPKWDAFVAIGVRF